MRLSLLLCVLLAVGCKHSSESKITGSYSAGFPTPRKAMPNAHASPEQERLEKELGDVAHMEIKSDHTYTIQVLWIDIEGKWKLSNKLISFEETSVRMAFAGPEAGAVASPMGSGKYEGVVSKDTNEITIPIADGQQLKFHR